MPQVIDRSPEIIHNPIRTSPVALALRGWTPKTDLGRAIRDAVRYLPEDLAAELVERVRRVVVIESCLSGVIYRNGVAIDQGVLSRKLVTDNGVGFLVDAFQNLVEFENMKYHGFGTGTTAEGATQTALVTELTTEYATDNTRPTGTTAESSANVLQSVATLTPNAGGTIAVTEHGLFSQAATGGGVLWDRSVFSANNIVANADSLQVTYTSTFSSGG